jgi:hypothetical protein|eukprot:COSAG01_NODE_33892_length_556_cov_44.334792_1_plen_136_part_00
MWLSLLQLMRSVDFRWNLAEIQRSSYAIRGFQQQTFPDVTLLHSTQAMRPIAAFCLTETVYSCTTAARCTRTPRTTAILVLYSCTAVCTVRVQLYVYSYSYSRIQLYSYSCTVVRHSCSTSTVLRLVLRLLVYSY